MNFQILIILFHLTKTALSRVVMYAVIDDVVSSYFFYPQFILLKTNKFPFAMLLYNSAVHGDTNEIMTSNGFLGHVILLCFTLLNTRGG